MSSMFQCSYRSWKSMESPGI